MAATTAKSTKTSAQSSVSADDLEADLAKLRADIAQLKKDLAAAGEQSYRTAKRAAYDGADQLRAQGEATLADIKASAREIEDQLGRTVREKPLTSLAMAAGAGFILALLARR
ncbi:MAG: hypothetical protein M9905_16210 [Rhizobiaceae bacterium]|nr:hypothetical protein [Rhizobiaceae bacterium]